MFIKYRINDIDCPIAVVKMKAFLVNIKPAQSS